MLCEKDNDDELSEVVCIEQKLQQIKQKKVDKDLFLNSN